MFNRTILARFARTHLGLAVIKQGSVNSSSESRETTSFYNQFTYDDSDFVAVDPPGLGVSLLPFQKMGVGWMVHRERRFSGGIMADHLGMGKTVQMIGLCLASDLQQKPVTATANELKKDLHTHASRLLTVLQQMQRIPALQNCSKLTQPGAALEVIVADVNSQVASKALDFSFAEGELFKWLQFAGRYHPAYKRKAEAFLKSEVDGVSEEHSTPELRTLLVVPASLVLQWKSELQKKILPDRNISVHVFHGDGKRVSIDELESFDFVITTYETVSMGIQDLIIDDVDGERFNREDAGPLFQIRWKRCILDEAHVIRNAKTGRWKAIKQLNAKKRWAVTATPLHNGIEDIQNLLEFVGSPTIPLLPEKNDVEAVLRDEVLQKSIAECLQPVFLRRGPVMVINGRRTVLVDLPEKEELVKTASLSTEESRVYNDVLTRSRNALEDSREKKVFHVFAMMTRLRQTCCHPALSGGKAVQIYLCGICKGEAASPIVTRCGHAFCHDCIMSRFRTESDNQGEAGLAVRMPCPVCDMPIQYSSLGAGRNVSSAEHIAKLKQTQWVSSTKVDMILHELANLRENFPNDKAVIFSHFTMFLDVISVALDRHNFNFVRVDGSMPIHARNQVVTAFQRSEGIKVMLASKTAVGVGLNLTMANHVFVVDPWWNPAIEEQAIHRCHRIGQTKKVYVKRFVTEGTIEQYCFEICQRKKEFGDSVLRAATGGDASASQKAQSKMVELVKKLRAVPGST